MARVSTAELQEIFETDLDTPQLTAFINTANAVVNANLLNKGLSSTMLKEIEKYLAAHFASLRDQRAQSEDVAGEYRVTYQGKTNMGYESTQYGQTALSLDSTGALASAGQKRASITVMSTPAHNTSIR